MAECTVSIEGSGVECDVKLDIWLKDALPLLPGAVRKVVKRELILACREFYERSAAWRVVIGPKTQTSGKTRYSVSPYDAYANIVYVISVEANGIPLMPYSRRPAGEQADGDSPVGFWMENPDTIRLWPTPNTTVENNLTFYVALTPKQSVTVLPRIAATHHYDAILDGLLGRCFRHPSKPYSNPQAAQYHLSRFRAAIGAFAGLSKQGYTQAQAWNFPRFGT